jgi:putative Holliday junction resolvase
VRALGLDLGAARIGIALSDTDGRVATAYDTVVGGGGAAADRRRLAAVGREVEAEVLVVGLPLSLDGTIGPAAAAALVEVEALGDATGLPVETYDERLTTVSAHQVLREQGLDAKARRAVVDKVAAAIILQGWLDQRSRQVQPPDGSDRPRA